MVSDEELKKLIEFAPLVSCGTYVECKDCPYHDEGEEKCVYGEAKRDLLADALKELLERRAKGKNGSLEAKYTPIEYMGDKAYMRTCPVCGDLVVIRPKTMGLENYCRNCATRLKPYKEEQEE